MRFIVMVKATPNSESGVMPGPEMFEAMGRYNEELVKAGIMKAGEGLHPSSQGARVHFAGSQRTVIDGPFTESKELIAGYTMIQTKTREEAMEWTRRFPAPFEGIACEIEVRQLFELDDFAPGESVERFRELETTRV